LQHVDLVVEAGAMLSMTAPEVVYDALQGLKGRGLVAAGDGCPRVCLALFVCGKPAVPWAGAAGG
jgi:hypothetical protein